MSTNPTDNNSGSDEPFFKGETPKLFAPQFHPSPKEISEEEIEKFVNEFHPVSSNDLAYPERILNRSYFRERVIDFILSLPSSGSKTEEEKYRISLIDELINMQEHPEDSNKEWKDAIISVAREKGYGNKK